MKEEIKETLEILKDFANNEISDYVYDYAGYEYETINNAINKVLDHITNLQQDLDKANDIIQKDRQFYKCRMDEYAELKKENEELNRMCELYSKSLYNAELTDYKSRLEKASNKLDSMFVNGEENKILDDLLELDKIVKGDKQ